MTQRFGRIWGVLALPAMLAAVPASAAPLAAFGRLPNVEYVTISPDGMRIALVYSDEASHQLQVRNANLTPLMGSNLGAVKLRGLTWVGSSHLIITSSTTDEIVGISGPRREYYMAADLSVPDGKFRRLLEGQRQDSLNTVVSQPEPLVGDGKPQVLIRGVTFPSRIGVLTLFRENLASGLITTIATGGDETTDFVTDGTGQPIARVDYNPTTGAWSLATKPSGGWRKVHSETALIDQPYVTGLGRTSDMLMLANRDGEVTRYREMPLAGGNLSQPIAALDDADLVTDPVRHTVIGGVVTDDLHVRHVFLDPADQHRWNMIDRAFPDATVRLESWSDDRVKLILKVEGAKIGAAFYLLDMKTHHADWIADEYAGVTAADVGEVRSIKYPAQDGLSIPAYLTLPHGSAGKGLPLVVLVHGGPAARDEPGFDWWAQALASRGYAVMQPQYRGSDGFGWSMLSAGFGQWGRKMQTDVSDGVRYLVDAGVADPARVCIVGASYGGYAALAGVALQNGIYRCAVSVAGPSDLRRMLAGEIASNAGRHNPVLRYWQRFMGAASPGDPALDAISPAHHADAVAVPLLLIHGLDDTVVPYAQSQAMAAAMKKAGKPVQFVTLKHEDHWLSTGETRLQMLQATADFLDKSLAPAAGGAPAR